VSCFRRSASVAHSLRYRVSEVVVIELLVEVDTALRQPLATLKTGPSARGLWGRPLRDRRERTSSCHECRWGTGLDQARAVRRRNEVQRVVARGGVVDCATRAFYCLDGALNSIGDSVARGSIDSCRELNIPVGGVRHGSGEADTNRPCVARALIEVVVGVRVGAHALEAGRSCLVNGPGHVVVVLRPELVANVRGSRAGCKRSGLSSAVWISAFDVSVDQCLELDSPPFQKG
jgi:hypothetical protein